MNYVRVKTQDGIGTIIMCRSEKMNAFNDPFIAEMIAAFTEMQDNDVRVIILRAEKNAKVWSAGRDVDSLPTTPEEIKGWEKGLEDLGRTVLKCPVPVIALVEGSVWGFGCELVFSCDLIVATPEAQFAITPAKLGVPYTLSGLRTVIERLGSNLAKEMLYCATPLAAERLFAQGVINHVVHAEKIDDFVYKIAKRISHLAPLSIAALKAQIADITRTFPLPPETITQSDTRSVGLLSSDDFKEGMSALKEKRQPKFRGH